ncbi:mucin-5AC-like [Portunus trituberculatus]|uniref:mucin-5AC-like n=1 Tax=Portunus trituberculatus TaxID=210409 RepID=UPI001E1CDBCB|nr:mucin-5AC-like [Portunus trituberculatus]
MHVHFSRLLPFLTVLISVAVEGRWVLQHFPDDGERQAGGGSGGLSGSIQVSLRRLPDGSPQVTCYRKSRPSKKGYITFNLQDGHTLGQYSVQIDETSEGRGVSCQLVPGDGAARHHADRHSDKPSVGANTSARTDDISNPSRLGSTDATYNGITSPGIPTTLRYRRWASGTSNPSINPSTNASDIWTALPSVISAPGMPDVLRQQYEKLASCVRESGVLSDHAKTNHPLYESGVRFVTSPNKLSPTLKHYVCLVYDDIASLDTPNAASPMKETQLPIIHPPLPSSEPSSTPSSTSLTPPESSTPNDTSTATSTDTLETPPQEAVAKVSIPFSTEATPENEEELGDQSMTPSPPATSSTPREAETTPTSLPSTTPTPPATSSTLVDQVPSSAVNKVQYPNFRPDQESDFTFSLSSTLAATSPPMELDSTTPIPTTYEATSDTSDAEESGDSTVTPTTAASSTNGVTEESVSTPVTLSEHTVASTQTVPTPFPSMSEEEVVVVPLDYLSVRLTTYPQSDYLPTLKPDSEAIHTTPMMYLTDLPEAHQADEPGTESLPSTVTGYPRTYLPETHEPMAETGTPITKHSTTSLPIETRPTAPSTVPTTPVSGSSTSINPPVLDGTEHVEGETKTRIPDQVTLPHNMDNEDEAIHSSYRTFINLLHLRSVRQVFPLMTPRLG